MKKIDEKWRQDKKGYEQFEEIEARYKDKPYFTFYRLRHLDTGNIKYIAKNEEEVFEITNQEWQESLCNLEINEAELLVKTEQTGEQTF